MGHATVAFNQGQVHSILRAVSTEIITSSLHQMKNILEEAIRVGVRSQATQQGPSKQRIKCFRKQSDSPGQDGHDSDVGTEGYTSKALKSEDEFVEGLVMRSASFLPQIHLAKFRLLRPDNHLPTKSPVKGSALLIMSHWLL